MTNEEAQKHAPSYLHMPNDGALFRCCECKQQYKHTKVIKPFTPDGAVHYCVCLNCIDTTWLGTAKDCGIAE